ncbi:hypothetical protein HFP89_14085 [Wenzhouxiangella sp. XN79A]|uniref:hypothetical protein n=1 Tax=Wenzhouxiangella sp. XN79A TaxID=2724193 RepID=UPI00144ACA83|nr:hypothetical protein [Wenzhouxiangella sp. XN79A]NKI36295.1 hypothetical protein [Wenzhouxiangella sp. XN79A]
MSEHPDSSSLVFSLSFFSGAIKSRSELTSSFLRESEITKSALLYADNVSIRSMVMETMASVTEIQDFACSVSSCPRPALLAIPRIAPMLMEEQRVITVAKKCRILLKKKRLSRAERDELKRICESLMLGFSKLDDVISFDEVNAIRDCPHVQLRRPKKVMSTYDEFATSFIWDVLESALDPSKFPYLDPWLGEILAPAIGGSGNLTRQQSSRNKHAGTATSVLLDLPVIRRCSLFEVLEIRQELHDHLVVFRKAIHELSKKVKSHSWERDFRCEVNDLIEFEIKPSVKTIERELSESTYFRQLYKRLIDSPPAITKTGYFAAATNELLGRMSIALGQSTEAAISSALLAAISVGTSAVVAANDLLLSKREISRDKFYFLYAAAQKRIDD